MQKRKIYLENTPLNEALEVWNRKLDTEGAAPCGGESLRAEQALGRVTAEAVFAKISAPFYHSSAMDGYAVRYGDTLSACEESPLRLTIGTGAFPVDTGDPLPDGCNAVIMLEDAQSAGEEEVRTIEIIKPAAPWQHVRVIGEDIVSTELVLPENHRIRAVDIGAVLSGGHVEVRVRRKPVVVLIPTGSEIVEPGTELKKGDIIEYNSRIMASLVTEWGGEPLRVAPVRDDPALLKQALLDAAAKGDLVIINAGSSAGSEDFSARVIAELGQVILHGINIKPGKPLILGWISGKPVIGIPGYPVSAYLTFHLFARPLVYRLQGMTPPEPEYLEAVLSRQVSSSLGQEEFVRVKLGRVGETMIATPVSRGAGVLMSLVRADGIVRIPAMSEGYGAGTPVRVEMLRDRTGIENTVVCIGSHDNALDILANILRKRYPRFSLSSAHVGSLGGLMAIKKGEAHLAGTHLLDEATGEYNVSSLQRVLPGRRMLLINLVYREQGFLVQKGNPKGILGFRDLAREDVVFINRQAGSGTRVLTDKHLRDEQIRPEEVRGYDREEYTHMGVASAVLTGIADAGMAILASAKALGLDFVPVAKERYDLAVPKELAEMDKVRALLNVVREDEEFRHAVLALGGYDVSDMGKIMYES